MISSIHLLRNSRASTPFHSIRSSKSKLSNYFSPSHSRLPRTSHLGLSRPRFFSSSDYAYESNTAANKRVLYALMGLNIGIFGYGAYTQAQAQAGFQEPWIKFMRNMTCNYTDVTRNGAWWTTMTSTFTHIGLGHLASNMFTLYFLGGFLCQLPIITPSRYLTIALGAGVLGSVGFLYQRYLKAGRNGIDHTRGLGFSGALMGLTSVAACLAPHTKFSIYGIIPVPLWGLCAAYGIYDGYYLNDNNSRIGHAGHLGGLVFGLAYYLLVLRGFKGRLPRL
ncbi:hypothetical protein DE146DRAFT_111936 [Phaeosphaeria sp. MPI-PUGE-AT-0046c]|nr:hypothetical protein DE146DRAFT_111936 [Phaeosphaeria sp. MPI-PUGE-AT-0046c]